jgi:hypothetical protein
MSFQQKSAPNILPLDRHLDGAQDARPDILHALHTAGVGPVLVLVDFEYIV